MQELILAAKRLAERPGGSPVRLLAPPFCYGAWRGPRIDLPILQARVAAAVRDGAWAVVLSDIPDDDDSLVRALDCDGVLGALAVGCGCLDVWISEAVAGPALDAQLAIKRGADSPLPRVVVRDPDGLVALWAFFERLASRAEGPRSGELGPADGDQSGSTTSR